MDEKIKAMIAAMASSITEWKANVEHDREVLRNAHKRTQIAKLSLDESIRILEDAQTSLYVLVLQESHPYKEDEDDDG